MLFDLVSTACAAYGGIYCVILVVISLFSFYTYSSASASKLTASHSPDTSRDVVTNNVGVDYPWAHTIFGTYLICFPSFFSTWFWF